jgi:hypothetical protein
MPEWYGDLLDSIVRRLALGRVRAIAAANQQVVANYWAVGRDILERQRAEGWGAKAIDRLSADIRPQYADIKGFSLRNSNTCGVRCGMAGLLDCAAHRCTTAAAPAPAAAFARTQFCR